MVPGRGLEPPRGYPQRIFVLLHITMAVNKLRCSLDHVFTIYTTIYLGGWCMASTHLLSKKLLKFSTAFCVRLRRLANFYSKGFPLGTLYDNRSFH